MPTMERPRHEPGQIPAVTRVGISPANAPLYVAEEARLRSIMA